MNPAEKSRSGSSEDSDVGSKNKGFFASLKRKIKKKNKSEEKMKPTSREKKTDPSNVQERGSSTQNEDSDQKQLENETMDSANEPALDAVESGSTTLTEKLNVGLSFQPEDKREEMEAFFRDDYYRTDDDVPNNFEADVHFDEELLYEAIEQDLENLPQYESSPESSTSLPPSDPEVTPTVEKLLSLRCRYQPVEELDQISPDALSVKFWILLQMIEGNCPAVLPMMSLRQTIVFSKIREIFTDEELLLQLYPPQGFKNFVVLLWTSSSLDLVPTGIVPKDLEALNGMLSDRQIRAFELGTSISEALEIWISDMKIEYASHFNLFNGLTANPENLSTGQQCGSPVDFITTMQFVRMSPDFIKTIGFDPQFFRFLQPKLNIPLTQTAPKYPLTCSLDFPTIGEIARQFWTESGRYDYAILYTANARSWNWSLCDWDWLVDSVKRKPRRIVGLSQKNQIVDEKRRKKAEQDQRDLEIIRNAEMPSQFEWEQCTKQGTSNEITKINFAEENSAENPTYSYTDFDTTETDFLGGVTDDWGDNIGFSPPRVSDLSRHSSSTTLYSTESENSLQSCRRSLDQISLASANSCDLVDPGY